MSSTVKNPKAGQLQEWAVIKSGFEKSILVRAENQDSNFAYMEENQTVGRGKSSERSWKKALLRRYLEDQVIYNSFDSQCSHSSDSFDDYSNNNCTASNTVTLKLDGENICSKEDDNCFNKRQIIASETLSSTKRDGKSRYRELSPIHAKFSRSLDERHFKSMHLEIPYQREKISFESTSNKVIDLTCEPPAQRKSSDCSNNHIRWQRTSSTSIITDDTTGFDDNRNSVYSSQQSVDNIVPLRGTGTPFTCKYANARKPMLSLSSLDGSLNDFHGCPDAEGRKVSASSFRSSCSNFAEIDFDDIYCDRSGTSSPACQSLKSFKLPPIKDNSRSTEN